LKYPRASRLTKRRDIERVREEGRALHATEFIARLSSSPFAYLRVGVVVPRYGHSAVERNRLKRRLREIIRQDLLNAPVRGDLVIWVRPAAYAVTFGHLQLALGRLRDRMAGQGDSRLES
jgi:ribonuclease P protein component